MMTGIAALFPNVLQPTSALTTYAPLGVKFWQGEQAILDGMKEFSDDWFARRHSDTKAALEVAKRMGEAATPLDAMREYQVWFGGAISRLVEDGLAYQRRALKTGERLGTKPLAEAAAKAEAELYGDRRTG